MPAGGFDAVEHAVPTKRQVRFRAQEPSVTRPAGRAERAMSGA
jgi:hypothetical protein